MSLFSCFRQISVVALNHVTNTLFFASFMINYSLQSEILEVYLTF